MEEKPEDLSNIDLMSKSAKKAYTLRDVADKQIGRVQYFLRESLVLKGKISKLSYPGTILINNSVKNCRTEMRPWQITWNLVNSNTCLRLVQYRY